MLLRLLFCLFAILFSSMAVFAPSRIKLVLIASLFHLCNCIYIASNPVDAQTAFLALWLLFTRDLLLVRCFESESESACAAVPHRPNAPRTRKTRQSAHFSNFLRFKFKLLPALFATCFRTCTFCATLPRPRKLLVVGTQLIFASIKRREHNNINIHIVRRVKVAKILWVSSKKTATETASRKVNLMKWVCWLILTVFVVVRYISRK